jgi:enoyl-CoA hydratase
MTANDRVLLERRPLQQEGAHVALLTLNRPEQLNAIDWDTIRALDSALDEVQTDRSVRALLITGAGRAFSAGGDLKGYIALQRDPVRFPQFVADLHHTFGRLRQLSIPAVALVNGVTAAGGLELLLSCDFAVAAESARIGDGHLNFGQMGGGGVLTLLPRLVGLQKATELVFSGRFLDAREAERWGLVSRCVADEALLDVGMEFAEEVARKSPLAVANAKEVMNALWAEGGPLDAGLRYEREKNAYYCLTSHDAPEGLQAFAEKRTPRFRGE